MKTRQSVIRKDHSIATAGTSIFDIVGDEPITRISILQKVTNPNAYVPIGHPDERISKVEIVDGSDVLYSASAIEGKPIAFYGTKVQPLSSLNYMALQWAFVPLHIYFGRHLNDPDMALDPNQFSNLQLRITHNLAAAMTSEATGYLDVVADIMARDISTPKGFLMTKELIQLDTVASAVEYVDLPADYPIRLLMASCFSDTQAPEYNVASFELYEGNRKNLLISYDMEDFLSMVCSEFPPWSEKVSGQNLTTDRNFWITPSHESTLIPADYGEANSVQTPEAVGGQKRIMSAEAAGIFEAIAFGWAPHGAVPFVFPGIDTPEAYWSLDRQGGGTVKIVFHGDVDTTPTYNLVAQQYRPY
jgi:hypothetical protein